MALTISPQDALSYMEKLREEREAQQATIRELQHEVSRGKQHMSSLDTQQLALTAEVEKARQERGALAREREEAVVESEELRERCRLSEEQLAAIREQVER